MIIIENVLVAGFPSAQDSNEKPAKAAPKKNKTQNSDQRKLVLGFCFLG